VKNKIKIIQQIALPTKINKKYTKYEAGLSDIDRLTLGLFCCNENPDLINLLVDYWINRNSIYNNINFWIKKGIVKFKAYNVSDSLKGELFAMKRIFPVNELMNLTRQSFPSRKETLFSILLMLRKCSYYVGVVLSEDDDVNYDILSGDVHCNILDDNLDRDWLASKTLDRIKDELLFLQSIPKNCF
jgi:hypothetical protein